VLLTEAPNALIVPISIKNSWKLLKYGKFPMGIGAHLKFEVHEPISNTGDAEQLIPQLESIIHKGVQRA
ncbi:MAG: 1-acyl-sn-glycerol-3-phosphate acyltransferase, partial [Cyanobacteria bacterium P01_F01_bin.153]